MLTGIHEDAAFFADLRAREFARLDRAGVSYLDYTGSALHTASQARAHDQLLTHGLFGNPHSLHAASAASSRAIADAAAAVLDMLGAGDAYQVCFTANATAAIKLVAEAFPFSADTAFVLSADNHNSVNGVAEFARRGGAPVSRIALDAELRLIDGARTLSAAARAHRGLFAYPAQSNFSGVRHPLSLVAEAKALGYRVLLDAAAYVPSAALDLEQTPADFVVLSFYKLFGLPTGVGALVARRDALEELRRPWFAGGTVEYVSVGLDRHQLRSGAAGFEDGTPHFLGIASLAAGFELRSQVGVARASRHVAALTSELMHALQRLSLGNGSAAVRVYGPVAMRMRGGTVAFNVFTGSGTPIAYEEIEARASACGVLLRGGCFCNPGAAEAAFGFDAAEFDAALSRMGERFSIAELRALLPPTTAVGALRASVGIASDSRDIQRLVAILDSFIE